MRNYEWLVYTYRHRRAFCFTIEKLGLKGELKEKMLERAKYHDLDKMLMYLFLDQKESMDYHVKHRAHHLESDTDKTYEDYVETIIDFECAPYTKPDKPLNAYDFTHKLLNLGWIKGNTADILFDIMKDLGIDKSCDTTKDEEVKQFVSNLGEITEDMILLEVMQYASYFKEELEYIKRIGEHK